MNNLISKVLKSTFGLLVILLFSLSAQATLPGIVVVDEENFWGHNGRFPNPSSKAAYVVCDGYIASPQIPNTVSAVNSFINNCEITPPPSALPVIDTPENHSRHYQGYPAYEIKPPGADYIYFVCDGFLNSTSWCSYEAHRKATKLQRVAESRHWEAGENPLLINDRRVIRQQRPRYTERNVTRYSAPSETYNQGGNINRAYPSKLERIQAQPTNRDSNVFDNSAQGETVVEETYYDDGVYVESDGIFDKLKNKFRN